MRGVSRVFALIYGGRLDIVMLMKKTVKTLICTAIAVSALLPRIDTALAVSSENAATTKISQMLAEQQMQ
ncbi:hypothetical protein BVX97_05770, partial [bacterium E08(2017)]